MTSLLCPCGREHQINGSVVGRNDEPPRNLEGKRLLGQVKSYSKLKGTGYVYRDENDTSPDPRDYFFHHSDINESGHRESREGAWVEYIYTYTEKGPRATDIIHR